MSIAVIFVGAKSYKSLIFTKHIFATIALLSKSQDFGK